MLGSENKFQNTVIDVILKDANCWEKVAFKTHDHFVKVGEYDTSANNDGAKVIKVKKVHNHPSYSSNNNSNDFSILELEKDLEFSESVRPACLPRNDASTFATLDGKFRKFLKCYSLILCDIYYLWSND